MRVSQFVLTSLVILFVAGTAAADVYTFRSYEEFQVNDRFDLFVSNTSGTITIEPSPSDLLIIDVEKKIRARDKGDAERLENEIEISIDAKKNRVRIETHYPDWNEGDSFWEKLLDFRKDNIGYVDYYIKIPSEVDLEVSSTSGAIRIFEQKGEFEIAITSGDVKVEECFADVDISATSGDVDLKDIEGDVTISSTSSDVLIERVNGSLQIRTTSGVSEVYGLTGNLTLRKTSGNTLIQDVIGNVDLSSTSGDIEISQEEGSILVTSQSGDVIADTKLLSGGRYVVETISGTIDFSVPAGADGRVKLQTVSGDIGTTLPLTIKSYSKRRLSGVLGLGGPRIELSSTSGDIKLKEQ